MAAHELDPLLAPRSVAVVGASARADSLGWWSLENLARGGFEGPVYPVNPRETELAGHRCYARLADLPERPELVVFAVGDRHVEGVLDEVIALGLPAAVIMSSLVLDDDTDPPLRERVAQKVGASGVLLCGGNGMGFYNVRDRVWACGFDSAPHEPPGSIALISQSGAGMSGLIDADERLCINLAVSTGLELGVTMDRYVDFALGLPETRAIGLFVETARDPQGFRAALAKAEEQNVPVVALKVGRTRRSAALTVSHSGVLAGDHDTYAALFDRYGVHVVRDPDELATLLILFAELHPVPAGGLVSLHDSGGERQLMVDLADEAGVPLAELAPQTAAKLKDVIDPELPAVNPLDAWSRGGEHAERQMTEALTLMLEDPGAALGVVAHDRAPGGRVYESYVRYMDAARAETGKPVALVASRQGTGADPQVVEATGRGMPVLDGLPAFLRGARALFEQRDRQAWRDDTAVPIPDPAALGRLRARLAAGETLDEHESLRALGELGLPVVAGRIVEREDELEPAAAALGYPLAAKTAMPGIVHKSDRGGVRLDLADADALVAAYRELAAAVGPRVLLAPMAPPGVEMLLGARRDPQFGPVVVLGSGGVHAELLADVVCALPPFTPGWARHCLDRLALRGLLDGVRGAPPADVDAYCEAASRFSAVVHGLGDALGEADVNPLIVGGTGCVAVDALLVGHDGR